MKDDDAQLLADIYPELEPPKGKPKKVKKADGWEPDLNPVQKLCFNESCPNTLIDGEKGSGKSIVAGHCCVRHAYENEDALVLIITRVIRVAKFGVGYDLENLILPAWRDGNLAPEWINGKKNPKYPHEYLDEGMGLEYTPFKQDNLTKDRVCFVANRFGGWSCLVLLSIPYTESIESRIKALSPSLVYVDELTLFPDPAFHVYVAAQIGRRRNITGAQQYIATANPAGPSHWVYKTWFVDCVDDKEGIMGLDGVKRDRRYKRYHMPVTDNMHRLPPNYLDGIRGLYKDPTEFKRMIQGIWIDRPSGDAIFAPYFLPNIHVRGDASKKIGIIPRKGFPIRTGWDPGPKNFSIHFEQLLPVADRWVWICFDELNFVGQLAPTKKVVPLMLNRMNHWCSVVGTTFGFEHISDSSAFNQKNSEGSFYARDIETYSKGKIKLRACLKGADPQTKDSVPARVQMMIALLLEESFIVSDLLEKTKDMFLHLVAQKLKDGVWDQFQGLRPVRSQWIHPFDSVSYPPFKLAYSPSRFIQTGEAELQPAIYGCGTRS